MCGGGWGDCTAPPPAREDEEKVPGQSLRLRGDGSRVCVEDKRKQIVQLDEA